MMTDVKLCPNAYVRCYGQNVFCWSQTSRSSKCYDAASTTGELLRRLSGRKKMTVSDDLLPCVRELRSIEIVQDAYMVDQPRFDYRQDKPYTSFGFLPKTSEGVQMIKKYFRINPTPFSLHFDLTMKCNERCIHCYIPNHLVSKLDEKTVCRVLTEYREMGGLHVEFSGGECFLFEGFHKVIAHAKKLDLSISIMSNLICVNDELADYLDDVRPSIVQVSLYSMNHEIHDRITQVIGSFAKTINALEMLFERNVPVEISCPCMSINASGYKRVLEFADEHKIRVCSDCIMLAKYNGESDNLKVRMSEVECEDVLRTILSHERQNGVVIEMSGMMQTERLRESKICDIGVDSIRVNANGDYYACPCFQGFPLGNCLQSDLRQVWEHSEQLNYLRALTWGAMAECLRCKNIKYCKPCMVRNYNKSGNLFKPDPYFCHFTELISRLSSECNEKRETCA